MERLPQRPSALLLALLLGAAPAAARAEVEVAAPAPAPGEESADAGLAAPAAMDGGVAEAAVESPDAEAPLPRYESVVTADPYDPGGTSLRQVRRGDLDRQGALSVAEALERSPAVYATTGSRNERILSIRGFDQRQTAVLVDGAPAFIGYDGQVDLGMIPADLVERIALLRGPGTVAVGPTGLGPAVSIGTRRAGEGPLLQGRFEGRWPDAWRSSLIHAQSLERAGYTVYAGAEQSRKFDLPGGYQATPLQPAGERLNSDRETWFAGGSARVSPAEKQELALSASYVDGDKGVPPSTLDDTPRFWRFNVWRGLAASLGHTYRGKVQVEELAWARLFDNRLDGYDDATFSTQETARAFRDWYHDRSFGLMLRLRAPLPEVLSIPSEVRAAATVGYDRHSDGSAEPAFQRVIFTGAPELTVDFTSRLSATLGCQVDAEVPVDLPGESTRSPVAAGPLAALTYSPLPEVTVGATVARRSRFPTLKERFSRGFGTRVANPDLQPESAWHFDLEASWRATRWLSFDVSGYDAEVDGLIESVNLGSGTTQMQNVRRARLAGAEVSARVKLQPWLKAEAGYAYLFAHRLGSDAGELAYRPAHKGSLGLVGTPWRFLEASTFVRLVGDQAFQHPTTLAWGTLTGYAVWDAQLEGRPWPGLSLYARATNLLDTFYQTEYGFPDPGRQLWVGLRLAFDRAPEGAARSP